MVYEMLKCEVVVGLVRKGYLREVVEIGEVV